MEKKRQHHQMTIPSAQQHLKKVVSFVEGLAQQAGFKENAIVDIAISTSEAVNNAILHGNKQNPRKKVTILVDLKTDGVVVRVRDEGKYFNPENICDPLEPQNLLKCNGRGILIQQALMDKVRFQAAPSGGTEVVLTKRFSATK